MKRITLLAVAMMVFTACEDDPVATTASFPTDDLALPEVRTSLMLSSYNPSTGYLSEIPRILLADAQAGAFTQMSLVNDAGNPLYSAISDSIAWNQPLAPAPAIYLNDQTVDPALLLDAVETASERRPLATVNHKVTRTDTAWLIDAKVKFWKDTINPGFRIETYMTASAVAKNHTAAGVNLNLNNTPGVVKVVNDASLWDVDIESTVDSTKIITAVNDTFYHRNVLVKNFNEESAWGLGFDEYSPFGQSLSAGDIIGTSTTPIRHFFYRPESGEASAYDPGYEYKVGFITIIWVQNQDTFKYEYVNSVMTVLD